MTAQMVLGSLCNGPCNRPLRPIGMKPADAPGTISNHAGWTCLTCTRHAAGQYTTRANEIKRRQDVGAIVLPVNVTPETMRVATEKVKRWFPGDSQLLDMLGMTA